MDISSPALTIAGGILIVYAIPAFIVLVFLFVPALTIGLTRTYMILTADDDDDNNEPLEDQPGPSLIGGV
jgi:hypothetical protein